MACATSNQVLAGSPSALRFFENFNPNVILIPTIVDTDKFVPNLQSREAVRSKFGFTAADTVIGALGPFTGVWNRLLLQFVLTQSLASTVKFLVIGEVDQEVARQNIYYSGRVEDLAGYMSALDGVLILRTYPTDGAINRILQSMSMSLPVIANDVAAATIDFERGTPPLHILKDSDILESSGALFPSLEALKPIGPSGREFVLANHSKLIIGPRLFGALSGNPRPDN